MNSFIKMPFVFILSTLILLTSACSVSRTNLEDSENLKYHLNSFAEDSRQAQQLVKAMDRSAETFKMQAAPENILSMFEEVCNSLPKGAVPVKDIRGHAFVKSHILKSYTITAKSNGLEKRAIQYLESLRNEYDADPTSKKASYSLVTKYIDSLKESTTSL